MMASTRTLSNYERLACCYDAWASWERPYVDAGFEMLQLSHLDDFLEVGSACGRLLARAGHYGGQCTGIDLSPNMCKIARRHCIAELGSSEVQGDFDEDERESRGTDVKRVKVICGNALRLLSLPPKPYEYVDAAAIMFTLELFDEIDGIALLKGIKKRLKKKEGQEKNASRLVVVAMSSNVENRRSCSMWCYACCHRNCSCIVDCRPINVVQWVKAAGFKVHARRVLPMYGLAVELVEARLF